MRTTRTIDVCPCRWAARTHRCTHTGVHNSPYTHNTHVCRHTRTQPLTHTQHACMQTHTQACTQARTTPHAHTQHTCMQTRAHTGAHTSVHNPPRTHTTHIYADTHAHRNTPPTITHAHTQWMSLRPRESPSRHKKQPG